MYSVVKRDITWWCGSGVRQWWTGHCPCQIWDHLSAVFGSFAVRLRGLYVSGACSSIWPFFLLGKCLWLWNAPLHWESSDFLLSSFGLLTNRQLNPLGNSDFNLWSSLPCEIRGQSCKGIWMEDENFSTFYSEQVTISERPDFLAFCLYNPLLQRPAHGFQVNMKLEAVDRRNPILIRVATIVDKDDHRIKVWPCFKVQSPCAEEYSDWQYRKNIQLLWGAANKRLADDLAYRPAQLEIISVVLSGWNLMELPGIVSYCFNVTILK